VPRAVMARPAQEKSEPGRGAGPSELKDDHTAQKPTTPAAVSGTAREPLTGRERSHS